ncbi:MAG: hypothetical protein NZO58_11685 [Gemmataceae bacterium]|nr:hypothetical protein [Gemmataceae bacterium]
MTRTRGEYHKGFGDSTQTPPPSTLDLELLDDLQAQLVQASVNHRDLLKELRSDAAINLDADDLRHLRAENAQLRARVEELEQQLRSKDKRIAPPPAASAALPKKIDDPELERLRRELDDRRRQLEEDEAALREQAREMELALAKDRAELARLRVELQRQQAEFTRELELVSRNPDLQEKLAALRLRQFDNAAKKPADPTAPPAEAAPRPSGLFRRLFG